jgi:hypothetical protein
MTVVGAPPLFAKQWAIVVHILFQTILPLVAADVE